MRHFVASFAGSVLFMGTLCAPPLLAQSVDTGILGVVRDASGGVIPGQPSRSRTSRPPSSPPS